MTKLIFSPEWLDELKSRCSIVDVISRYVPLKKSSRDYVGVCPFHNEKTPSFMINEAGQYYHCFGCKESGDVVKFLQKYENITFYEAVQKLAEMANMPLPAIDDDSAKLIRQKKAERDQMINCLRDCAKYYFQNLNSNHPQAKVAREYLAKRDISKESIVRFGIGCSLDFDSVGKYLKSKGYSTELIKKAGILSENEGRIFDAYGKRLIFPLINTESEVLGFSGRILEAKELAKYKNTTQTPVFNKSEIVFAINLLKKQRDKERKECATLYVGFPYVIICEGQIDVITMHQFGFTNTVACLGTALTPMHARKIKQFSDNIILLMDGDEAGRKAALRSIDTLRASGLNVRVVTIPENHDPDEFLHMYGAEAMKKLLEDSTEGVDYKIKVLANKYDLNSHSGKSKFIHEALVVIKMLDEESTQDIYLKVVQKYAGVPIEILRTDLQKINTEKEKPFYERNEEVEDKKQTEVIPVDAYNLADQFILASLLFQKPYAKLDKCKDTEFIGSYKNVYKYINEAENSGSQANISGLYSRFDIENDAPEIKQIINYNFIADPLPEFYFESCILKNIEKKYLREKETLENNCGTLNKEDRDKSLNRIFELAKILEEVNDKVQTLSMEHMAKMNELNSRNSRLKKQNKEE